MDSTLKLLENHISSWHRSNKLFVDIQELSTESERVSIFEFPFIGAEKYPQMVTLWKEVELQHADRLVHLMPALRHAEGRLAGNTKNVKEIFRSCIDQTSTTLDILMKDFGSRFNYQHQRNPDIHPTKDWIRKLDGFYETACTIVDFRHSGRQTCLRKLMGNSGYTEVILSFRNACLGLIEAEIEYFRHSLRFLWKLYVAVCHAGLHSDLSLGHFAPPVFRVNDHALSEVKKFIEECDLEAKVKLDRFITSGTPEEEQCSFLDIIDDDEDFWWKILQAVRFHLDEFIEVFTRKLSRPVRTERNDEDQLDELVQTEIDSVAPGKGLDSSFAQNPEFITEAVNLDNVLVTQNDDTGLTDGTSRSDQNGSEKDLKAEGEMSLKDRLLAEVRDMDGQESAHCIGQEPEQTSDRKVAEETFEPGESQDWLDVFEEKDMEALFMTVRQDILNRQRLKMEQRQKKAVTVTTGQPVISQGKTESVADKKEGKSQLQVEIERRNQRSVVRELLTKAVDQEVNQTMLRICRFIVECIGQSGRSRSVARETFCVLDTWLKAAHQKEQNSIDGFADTAAGSFEPDDKFAVDDPKRWTMLA
ncbi:hypothetical protein RvY_01790 [Ramazzottius varieornatus]|uniref:Uncharacterized protein n=1 Tax=Ramazzottius varieornatus TaxID=947166 RepID=A0A1D1US96_RAMVA|nr:hypothetical protein RvY_01790 [Ramazzottius varieornatus]